MSPELKPKRLRWGETTTKPLGGHVANEPFSCSLYNLAISRGYETQTELGKFLGIDQTLISRYYRGLGAPSPEVFGKIISRLDPDEEQRVALVDSYGTLLQQGKGLHFADLPQKTKLEIAEKNRKALTTPFGRWVHSFCEDHSITLVTFFSSINIQPHQKMDRIGLSLMREVSIRTAIRYGLNLEEIDALQSAVSETIAQRKAKGHKFINIDSGHFKG